MKKGKRYLEAAKLIEKIKAYEVEEAMKLVLQTGTAKFDETVELHMRLGVDPKHADQQVRGVVVLPNGTGKSVKVLVIAKVLKLTRQQLLVQIMLVQKKSLQKFKTKVGLILMSALQHLI